MKKFVTENVLEGQCCYFVKNINYDANVCFVHKFSEGGKTFQNLDISDIPSDTKKEDVLVLIQGVLTVNTEITEQIAKLKSEILESYEETKALFSVEGEEYVVSDKSDDVVNAHMSLRTKDGAFERADVKINSELYNKIRFGSKVRFESGKYIFVE